MRRIYFLYLVVGIVANFILVSCGGQKPVTPPPQAAGAPQATLNEAFNASIRMRQSCASTYGPYLVQSANCNGAFPRFPGQQPLPPWDQCRTDVLNFEGIVSTCGNGHCRENPGFESWVQDQRYGIGANVADQLRGSGCQLGPVLLAQLSPQLIAIRNQAEGGLSSVGQSVAGSVIEQANAALSTAASTGGGITVTATSNDPSTNTTVVASTGSFSTPSSGAGIGSTGTSTARGFMSSVFNAQVVDLSQLSSSR